MKKIIALFRGKIDFWQRSIIFFSWVPTQINDELQKNEFVYLECSSFEQFKASNAEYNEFDELDLRNRFQRGHILCFYYHLAQIICYGWINPTMEHFVGELEFHLEQSSESEVLYDFHTKPEFRGKGLYPKLLLHICSRNKSRKIIYILIENKSSEKGILKAKFRFLCVLKWYNKRKTQLILDKDGKINN